MVKYYIYKKEEDKIIYEKYGNDTFHGVNYRKIINARSEDVVEVTEEDLLKESFINENYYNYAFRRKNKEFLGTVLHFDADKVYLEKSMALYKKLGVYCCPVLCSEIDLEEKIKKLNLEIIPDVVVLTGHDYFSGGAKKEMKNYKNSKFYCEGIKIIRKKYPQAIVVAGACQSNYEALIASGANFASSPGRINVHIYDPAIIAVTICVTHIRQTVDFTKLEKIIKNLKNAYGGIETYGKMRMFY